MQNLTTINTVKRYLKTSIPAVALGLITSIGYAADLTVTVDSIENATGEILLAVYDNEGDFQKTPRVNGKLDATVGEVVFKFTDLPAGNYAILVYQDENGNGKLDSNLIGMPKEPWGASLQGKKLFGAPGWKDTRFELTENNADITITLN